MCVRERGDGGRDTQLLHLYRRERLLPDGKKDSIKGSLVFVARGGAAGFKNVGVKCEWAACT